MATIAHLANLYGPRSGGLRTSMNELARQYALAGHEVHLIVPSRESEVLVDGRVTTHHLKSPVLPGSGGYRVMLGRRRIRTLLEEISPDAVEISDRFTLLHAADWARERGISSAVIAHERLDGVMKAFAPWLPRTLLADRINRAAARRADSVVCTTDFAGEEFARIKVPVRKIPLGVDLVQFHPGRRSDFWHAQFGCAVVLLLCSRLSKEKEPGFAIDVLRECRRRGIDAHLVIAGDGPMAAALQRQSADLPVTMLGFVSSRSELARFLASADVILAPGPIETFGLAALEALASGTPAIVNKSSALPEIIGLSAGRALPLDPGAWASSIDLITADHDGFRAVARTRAERFTWQASARRMLAMHGLKFRELESQAA
jgi:alpha-1,6-mannosyltransferase